jgi:hypothetical protein
MTAASTDWHCGACVHFSDDPRALEQTFVGMTILSSAWGDTRGDQGLCKLHDRFLQPVMRCPAFVGRAPEGGR